jgi:hypothetical protein
MGHVAHVAPAGSLLRSSRLIHPPLLALIISQWSCPDGKENKSTGQMRRADEKD